MAELDKYVVGQHAAKRAVAIALRNRMRRQKLSPELAEEIMPKNIIMIGPTGVGKTEIARRLAKLTNSPFLKIEASKFTEVGYVGRDVESIVRDLVEISIDMVREEKLEEVEEKLALVKPSMPSLELVVGHAVFGVCLVEGGLVHGDLLDVQRLGVGGVELARQGALRGFELGEKFGRDGEKIAAGELRDFTNVAEAGAHDLRFVAELLVVVVDLGDGLDAGIVGTFVVLAGVGLVPVEDAADEEAR